MANNIYIGERYVPKFDGDWDATKSYEPLLIVKYGNNTYTSKRPVPVGQAPTGSDDDPYWALTGNYNGQIQEIMDDIQDLQDFDSALSDSLNYPPHKVMLILDSYGNRVTTSGKTLDEIIAEKTGLTVDAISVSGGGLINGLILNAINAYTGDGSQYDTVIYAAGANDEAGVKANWADMNGYFAGLKTAIDAKFPNAKNKFVAAIGQTFTRDSTYTSEKNRYYLYAYRLYSRAVGFGYIYNMEYILRDDRLLEADLCHPNSDGLNKLALYFIDFLRTGKVDVQEYLLTSGTDKASRTFQFYFVRHNNVVSVKINQALGYIVNGGSTTIPVNGTLQDLTTLDHSLVNVDTTESGIYVADGANPLIISVSGRNDTGLTVMLINNKEIKGYLKPFALSGITGNFQIMGGLIFNEF